MALKLRMLAPAIGAEVRGVDLEIGDRSVIILSASEAVEIITDLSPNSERPPVRTSAPSIPPRRIAVLALPKIRPKNVKLFL